MDLTKFNENYRVVSQEPVEVCYDIVLIDNLGLTSEDGLFPLINSYEEQDEKIWSNKPIQYFIYEDGTEVFQTTDEEELLREIKRLASRLNNQDESLTEEQDDLHGLLEMSTSEFNMSQLNELFQTRDFIKRTFTDIEDIHEVVLTELIFEIYCEAAMKIGESRDPYLHILDVLSESKFNREIRRRLNQATIGYN